MNTFFALFGTLLLLPGLLVRWLRWLAILQQKEYRFDRLRSFLSSTEGRRDVLRIFPRVSDFSRSGLKRPTRTARSIVIAALSAIIVTLAVLSAQLSFGMMGMFLSVVCILFFLPVVLFFATLPTALFAEYVVRRVLVIARNMLEKQHPLIIGIGGSYGKTSTKHLIAHVLSQKYTVFMTPKSHNTKYSIAQSIVHGYQQQQVAILEYGAYNVGEIAYLTRWFPPNLVVETGFSLQHLQLFGSVEKSQQAEAELVAALPMGEKVYFHAADEGTQNICKIGSALNRATLIPYSGPNAQVRVEQVQLTEHGHLRFVWRGHMVHTQLLGRHYLPNVQAAVAVAQSLGVAETEIVHALNTFMPNDAFVQRYSLENGAQCIDDGETSNPQGFLAAIQLAEEFRATQKILITPGIIDLGDESAKVHSTLAQHAAHVFDEVWYVGVDGSVQFQAAFKNAYTEERHQIEQRLQSLHESSLLLMEGRIPKWLADLLRKKHGKIGL